VATIIALTLFAIPSQTHESDSAISEKEVVEKVVVIPSVPEILKKISWCESRDRQFKADGSIHRGAVNPQDVGKYQINEYYHLEASRKLGMDIYTEKGNTDYALYLFKHQGTRPWNWSKFCWGGVETLSELKLKYK